VGGRGGGKRVCERLHAGIWKVNSFECQDGKRHSVCVCVRVKEIVCERKSVLEREYDYAQEFGLCIKLHCDVEGEKRQREESMYM